MQWLMKLSDRQIKQLCPREKPYKVSDGHGLCISIQPNGSKYWRYKYYWENQEKCLAFGVYPEITLEEARALRQEARALKRQGIDPREHQRTRKIRASSDHENTFEKLALEWLDIRSSGWSPGYIKSITARLHNDILPEIGHRPVGTILPMDILKIARAIEKRDCLEISHKSVQVCGQIFRYGIVTGRAVGNPADNLWPALRRRRPRCYPFFTPPQLQQFLHDLEHYDGAGNGATALQLMLLTFVRTRELCDAQRHEFDMERSLWRIPAERMKMNAPHLVPLATQTKQLLRNIKENRWGHLFSDTVTPRKAISHSSMRYVLNRLGYKGEASIHGIRATASTILNESGLFSADAIERQLAHQEPNKIRRAYDHSNHLAERAEMMQWWADYLTASGLRIPGHDCGKIDEKKDDIVVNLKRLA